MSLVRREDLKIFQERASSALASMIQEYPSHKFRARYDPDTGEQLPFLCRLRAITGAGKTPILALTAQLLQTGIILWTTNRGAIISQTLTNLRPGGKYSELLPVDTQVYNLGEMSPSDWERAMSATSGLTIFLSTVAAFNQDGDKLKIHKRVGDVTRWEMLSGKAGSVGARQRPLFVFYDEGHGATDNQFRKLRELKPAAFVLASASPLPEDLVDLLSGSSADERQASMALRTHVVSTKEVVLTGLLKQRLYFVDCNTAKADAIHEAHNKWIALAAKPELAKTPPIACFIVNETARGVDIWEQLVELGVSPSKIAVHLNGARDVIVDRRGVTAGLIDTYSGKNSQERSPEKLATAGYTHIIWNLTLREGWDEPLAYVAYLDGKGRSAVDIVQKIGRFVRQPNAKPFEDSDLNAAYFYFNVSDEAFASIIEQTQSEMATDGYEVIPADAGKRPPSSRMVEVRSSKKLPQIAPWFGADISALDDIILKHVPMFADSALQSSGSIRTRVFEMKELQENVDQRSERPQEANDVVTPWEFIATRLGAIDARIVNGNGSIFSANLKNHDKLTQPMQHGSEAMSSLANVIPAIRDDLNDQFQLRGLGKHGSFDTKPFNLVSPDIETANEAYRQKYKVRSFKNSLHAEYNGLNPFELKVANALDETQLPWCRNPANATGYRIPIQELGSDTIWFYPDFLFWTSDEEVWALDPKGKHLLEAAVVHKLLDVGSVKGLSPMIKIGMIVEGKYAIDQQGNFSKSGKEGVTLVRKSGVKAKALSFPTIAPLLKSLMKP